MALIDSLSASAQSNLHATWSLRKVVNAYSEYAIKISDGTNEVDVAFNGSGVVDTDSAVNPTTWGSTLNSFASGSNCTVTTWYDQSGNGWNATQSTASLQPKIWDSSGGLLIDSNDNPKIEFDDDYLLISSSLDATTQTSNLVLSQTNDSNFQGIFSKGNYNGARFEWYTRTTNNYAFSSGGSYIDTAVTNDQAHKILTLTATGSPITLNIYEGSSNTYSNTESFSFHTISTQSVSIGFKGSGQHFTGFMQEITFFGIVLDSTDRGDLISDQDAYWINPPSGIEITHSTGVFNFPTTTHSIAVTSSGAVNHSTGVFSFPTTTHSVFGANNIEITHTTGVFNFPTTTHSIEISGNVDIAHTTGVFNFPTTTHSIEGGGSIEITHSTGVFNFPTTTHSIAMSDNIFITHTTGVLNFPTTTHSIDITENVFITHTTGVFNFPTTTHLITTADGVDIAHTTGVFNFPTTTVRVGVLPDYNVWSNRQSILFGGENDTRVFLYGNGNKYIYSELADGVPSAEYFPESNSVSVSSDNYDITAITKQYDRLTVHKENESHYVTYENNATLGTIFSVFPLNDSIGNVAFGEARLIQNNPFVVADGVYEFTGSNVRDERNAVLTSRNVQLGLNDLTLSNAVTFDWERNFEYFLAIGTTVYVFNYKVNVWYKYTLADTPTCFIEIDGECYFGTNTGAIMKFDTTKLTDNGTLVTANWETGYIDFGANWIRKFLTYGWFHLEPEGRSKCDIDWISDQGSSTTSYELKYNNLDFSNSNFSDYSFSTNYTPKPFREKLKAKKFSLIKIIGSNSDSTSKMTILGISLNATTGGQVK